MNNAIAAVLAGTQQVALIQSDIRDLFANIPDASIDLISTDPPYDTDALWLYTYIFLQAHRVLKPGGHLVYIIPQYVTCPFNSQLRQYLPVDYAPDPDFRLRWTVVMNQYEGPHPRMVNANRIIEVMHKELQWYTRYPLPMPDYRGIRDAFDNKPLSNSDRLHKWQQSTTWADWCAQLLPHPNKGVLLDPLMGVGTMPLIAAQMGHRVIGSDLDPQAVADAQARFDEELL